MWSPYLDATWPLLLPIIWWLTTCLFGVKNQQNLTEFEEIMASKVRVPLQKFRFRNNSTCQRLILLTEFKSFMLSLSSMVWGLKKISVFPLTRLTLRFRADSAMFIAILKKMKRLFTYRPFLCMKILDKIKWKCINCDVFHSTFFVLHYLYVL